MKWSEKNHVAIITLAAPTKENPVHYAFNLGSLPQQQLKALADALVTGTTKRKVAPVVDSDLADDVSAAFTAHPTLTPFQPVPCELGTTAVTGAQAARRCRARMPI